MHSGLTDLSLAPALTALLQLGGQGPAGQGKEEVSSWARNRKAGGSATEARMTALPAAGREGQWRQTTARQEGCTFFRAAGGGWAAMEPLDLAAQACICPGF